MKTIFSFSISLLCFLNSFGQPSFLDTTFGNGNGFVSKDLMNGLNAGTQVKVLDNGRIFVAAVTGSNDLWVAAGVTLIRYMPNGEPDSSYGTGGITDTRIKNSGLFDMGYWLNLVYIYPDGKVLLVDGPFEADYSVFSLVRFSASGSPDSSFGINGRVTISSQSWLTLPMAVCVQQDGKILLSGVLSDYSNTNVKAPLVMRLNNNGAMDVTFGAGGITYLEGSFLAQGLYLLPWPDGKIVTGGMGNDATDFESMAALVGFNANGSLDYSFGINGIRRDPVITQPFVRYIFYNDSLQQKIYIAGSKKEGPDSVVVVTRYLKNGAPDLSFGNNGSIQFSAASELEIGALLALPDSRIVVVYNSYEGYSYICRYNNDGSPDTGFGMNGVQQLSLANGSNVFAMDVQRDGKLVFAGAVINNDNDIDILLGRIDAKTVTLIDPGLEMVGSDTLIHFDPEKINDPGTITGVAADGVSKLLLIVRSNTAVRFSMDNAQNGQKNGTISSLDRQDLPVDTALTVDPVNGIAVAVYTAPDGYGDFIPLQGRDVTVYIAAEGLHTETVIKLYTPPIVLVHGMWSEPDTWKDHHFLDYLHHSQFDTALIELADYCQVNASSFDPWSDGSYTARKSVDRAIGNALKRYRKHGIVASQVDVIAHSLGGLMVRSYAQTLDKKERRNYFEGSIHKFISIGTPHRGSPLGPVLYENRNNTMAFYEGSSGPLSYYFGLFSFTIGECLRDFASNSTAISHLMPTDFYAHAIAGNYKAPPGGLGANGKTTMDILCRLLSDKTFDEIFESSCGAGYGVVENDLIVPVNSQLGSQEVLPLQSGEKGYSIFWGVAHSFPSAGPIELESQEIQQQSVALLLNQDGRGFTPGMFAPSAVPKNCEDTELRQGKVKSVSHQSAKISDNPGNRAIRIVQPVAGTSYVKGDSLLIRFETVNGAIPSGSLCFIKGVGVFPVADTVQQIKVLIPEKAPVGLIEVGILCRDSSSLLLADTSHIDIAVPGSLEKLKVTPEIIFLDSTVRQLPVSVYGYFYDGNSGLTENLSQSSTGTSYASLTGSGIFSVSPDGVVSAEHPSFDTLLVTYRGQAVKIPVIVDETFLQAEKFQSFIEFPPIENKKTEDAPFVIQAAVSSGKPVSFEVLEGNVSLSNGLLTIEGPGQVVIKATAEGDVYFSAPTPVIRSFLITDAALPLLLLDFSGAVNGGKVTLSWKTFREVNVRNFVIEKSTDGINFQPVATVAASGSPAMVTKYQYTDQPYWMANGRMYYRLRAIDFDLGETISNIITVINPGIGSVTVFPNPASQYLHVKTSYGFLPGLAELLVIDMAGRVINQYRLASHSNSQIDISVLTSGLYELIIKSGGTIIHRQKLLITR